MTVFVSKRAHMAAVLAGVLLAALVPMAVVAQEGPPYKVGAGVSAPEPIYKLEPNYTEEARANRIEGPVVLATVVDEYGIPTELQVVQSLDPGLDTEAIKAVKQWRFKPGMKDGKPVAVHATMEVRFKLQ